MAEFYQSLQNVPQEVFDLIYDATLSCSQVPNRVWINRQYTPPVALQVDRETRDKFAERYYHYSFTVFHIDCNDGGLLCARWLASLEPRHHNVTGTIHCHKHFEKQGDQLEAVERIKELSESVVTELASRSLTFCYSFLWYHCFGKPWIVMVLDDGRHHVIEMRGSQGASDGPEVLVTGRQDCLLERSQV